MLAKIGRENRFPRDPHMLGLLSWKQEQVEGALYCTVLYCTVLYTVQVEGVAIVTIVVENILKELDIDQSKVALLKVNTN